MAKLASLACDCISSSGSGLVSPLLSRIRVYIRVACSRSRRVARKLPLVRRDCVGRKERAGGKPECKAGLFASATSLNLRYPRRIEIPFRLCFAGVQAFMSEFQHSCARLRHSRVCTYVNERERTTR